MSRVIHEEKPREHPSSDYSATDTHRDSSAPFGEGVSLFLIDLLRPVTVRSLMGTFAGFKHDRVSIHQTTRMSTVLRQDRRSPQPAMNYRRAMVA